MKKIKAKKQKGKKENPDAKFSAAFERWKSGAAPVLTLCKELGIHSGHTLTKIFKRLAGGVEQYQALRKQGAGGGHIPFGGKRAAPRTHAQISLDDGKVKTVRSGKHWKDRIVWEPVAVRVKTADGTLTFPWREKKLHVFISPKGNEYVIAKPTEKADLLVNTGFSTPVRLRKLERSSALKKHKHEQLEVARGKKAHAERKKAKTKKAKHLKKMAAK